MVDPKSGSTWQVVKVNQDAGFAPVSRIPVSQVSKELIDTRCSFFKGHGRIATMVFELYKRR